MLIILTGVLLTHQMAAHKVALLSLALSPVAYAARFILLTPSVSD